MVDGTAQAGTAVEMPTGAEMGLTKEFLDELALMNKQRRSYYRKKHFKKLVDSNALTREQADLAMASIAKYKNIVGANLGHTTMTGRATLVVLPITATITVEAVAPGATVRTVKFPLLGSLQRITGKSNKSSSATLRVSRTDIFLTNWTRLTSQHSS